MCLNIEENMKLSEKAWDASSKVLEAILSHPFNAEVISGSLPTDKFLCYIEQDAAYLEDFAKCNAIISSRVPYSHADFFLSCAKYAIQEEQQKVHQYFRKKFKTSRQFKPTTATIFYTSYLIRTCSIESVEVAIASVLPCFMIYLEVGRVMAKSDYSNSPYARWIEEYAGENFTEHVNKAIEIFDSLASTASEEVQKRAIDAFYTSSCLEWHFWNDAYNFSEFVSSVQNVKPQVCTA